MLIDSTATDLLRHLTEGSLSSAEVCRAYLDRIDGIDSQVGAFLSVDPDDVMAKAKAIDDRRAAGKELGRLAGLPVAVKDLLCTRGHATTCGSRMLENFVPPYDATVVTRLRAADAVVIGKTNLDEFAMGGSTESSALGKTSNPWDTERVPGGSSGGSAAAVAAQMVPLALGSDTGGSIRQPAAFCNVVGLKPTYGRVSRFGLVAFASSLDQIGPMARSVEDVALLLEVIAGNDSQDATSAPHAVPAYSQTVSRPLEGLKLGIVSEHFSQGIDREVETAVRDAISVYRALGAEMIDVSMPHSKYGIATYYIIAPCEASSNLARYDGAHYGFRAESNGDRDGDGPLVAMYRDSRSQGFGDEVKRRIMLGTFALSAGYGDKYYLQALKVRRLIRQDYDAAFKTVDFLIGPVTPTPAFKIGELTDDPMAMYLGDLYTVTTNLAGVAGLSIPCGFNRAGLPIGLQLQSRPFDEERLLQAGNMYQQATDWHKKTPTIR